MSVNSPAPPSEGGADPARAADDRSVEAAATELAATELAATELAATELDATEPDAAELDVADGSAPVAESSAEPDSVAEPIVVTEEKTRDLTWLRRGLLAVWALALAMEVAANGLAFDRTRLIAYLAFGMAAATIGRRRVVTVFIDWLPFVLILMLYDWTRSIAVWLGMPTQWHLAVDVDHWMFGTSPTAWLQSHIKFADPPWWEFFTSAVYMSYFIVPYATAAYLWVRDRGVWRRFAACFIAVSFIGLIGYTLVPAAPPWAAAKCTAADVAGHPHDPDCMYDDEGVVEGNLLGPVTPSEDGAPYVERMSHRGWQVIGVDQAGHLLKKGQSGSNLVAAIPSLHAALTMLLALFMWPRVKALGKTLFMGYAVTMAFTLVYTAEHYVFDIILGWGLSAAVIVVYQVIDRKYVQPRNARKEAEREQRRQEAVAEALAEV